MRGSMVSRSPSPNMLMAKTVTVRKTPDRRYRVANAEIGPDLQP